MILDTEKRYPEAAKLYMQAVEQAAKGKMDSIFIIPCILQSALCYDLSGNSTEAEKLYQRGLKLAENNNVLAYKSDAYKYMSQGFFSRGDSVRGRKYLAMSDSIDKIVYDEEDLNAAQNRLHRTENELHSEREKALSRKIGLQLAIIAGCLCLVGILLWGFITIRRKNRRLQEAYQLLIRKERIITSYEEQRLATRLDAATETDHITDIEAEEIGLSGKQYQELVTKINDVLKNPDFLFSSDFSLTVLSKEVGTNYKYVSLTLNKFFDKNFKSLVNELRVREAAGRLGAKEYKNEKIADLAQKLGYQSSTVFINAFKAVMGMTPGAYRRAALNTHSDTNQTES